MLEDRPDDAIISGIIVKTSVNTGSREWGYQWKEGASAQVRSGMKPEQTERVIRNRTECLEHVIVIKTSVGYYKE